MDFRTADTIVALKDGQVHEEGTHNELMAKKDLYYSLVMRQMGGKDEIFDEEGKDKTDEEEDEEEVVAENGFARAGSTKYNRQFSAQVTLCDLVRSRFDPLMPRVQKLIIHKSGLT